MKKLLLWILRVSFAVSFCLIGVFNANAGGKSCCNSEPHRIWIIDTFPVSAVPAGMSRTQWQVIKMGESRDPATFIEYTEHLAYGIREKDKKGKDLESWIVEPDEAGVTSIYLDTINSAFRKRGQLAYSILAIYNRFVIASSNFREAVGHHKGKQTPLKELWAAAMSVGEGKKASRENLVARIQYGESFDSDNRAEPELQPELRNDSKHPFSVPSFSESPESKNTLDIRPPSRALVHLVPPGAECGN